MFFVAIKGKHSASRALSPPQRNFQSKSHIREIIMNSAELVCTPDPQPFEYTEYPWIGWGDYQIDSN